MGGAGIVTANFGKLFGNYIFEHQHSAISFAVKFMSRACATKKSNHYGKWLRENWEARPGQ
jgi:hypothetical protein